MRLDLFLSENGLCRSRTEAKVLISDGAVFVDGRLITKPSFDVNELSRIDITGDKPRYVSRGGYKLSGALECFNIDVLGKRCIDVGASSGGFTDCLLQNGAEKVIAIDSGTLQLAESLRSDLRVSVMENYNARYLRREDLDYVPNMAVMDVSFISATYLIPAIYECLDDNSDFICLIKPQFEVGKSGLGKGGIVKNEAQRRAAVEKVVSCAETTGFESLGVVESPIKGGDGNVEYLAYFKKSLL